MGAPLSRPRVACHLVARKARLAQDALGGDHAVGSRVVVGDADLTARHGGLEGGSLLEHERIAAHVAHAQTEDAVQRLIPAPRRLQRDPAHQVAREVEAGVDGETGGRPCVRGAVGAPQLRELGVVEALHPEADARGPRRRQRAGEGVCQRFGIGLGRELDDSGAGTAHLGDEPRQPLTRHGGRSSPDVARADAPEQPRRRKPTDEGFQRRDVSRNERVAVGSRVGCEVAVAAAPDAERDVEVEGAEGHAAAFDETAVGRQGGGLKTRGVSGLSPGLAAGPGLGPVMVWGRSWFGDRFCTGRTNRIRRLAPGQVDKPGSMTDDTMPAWSELLGCTRKWPDARKSRLSERASKVFKLEIFAY